MDFCLQAAVREMLAIYRSANVIKALYPDWNGTAEGVKNLLSDSEKASRCPSLKKYAENCRHFTTIYQTLSLAEKCFLSDCTAKIRACADLHFQEDTLADLRL